MLAGDPEARQSWALRVSTWGDPPVGVEHSYERVHLWHAGQYPYVAAPHRPDAQHDDPMWAASGKPWGIHRTDRFLVLGQTVR